MWIGAVGWHVVRGWWMIGRVKASSRKEKKYLH